MEDVNIGMIPIKNGTKIILEAEVVDENLAFDFIGKCLAGRSEEDIKLLGIKFDCLSFNKNRFNIAVSEELRMAISNKLSDAMRDINEMISNEERKE